MAEPQTAKWTWAKFLCRILGHDWLEVEYARHCVRCFGCQPLVLNQLTGKIEYLDV